MPHPAITFTRAITRRPARSATRGLRAHDRGAPDIARMQADHAAYVRALEDAGLRVSVLEPLESFPDSVFVEDVALCLPEGAVLLRPGAPSRAGEVAAMTPALEAHFDEIRTLPGAGTGTGPGTGTVEGGDILFTPREILVGLSARTTRAGAEALGEILAGWGHRLRICETPPGVLHFKTDSALLDEETILATPRLAASGCFAGYRVLHTPEGEEAAANAIRVNDRVILPAGFPRTAEMLAAEGYVVTPLRNDEFALLDGGMSCLSLRF